MAKSTIILADTDEKFLTPLELKFLEELDENAELEIITDEEYFHSYFSSPKSASVLVVSENLYSSELQKHNINSIFVLTEDTDEGGTEDLGVDKIFKYTSTKEIYKQVTALSPINSDVHKEKETIVVLVYSASGGVGKSTVALGISEALARGFNKVLYINAERLNSFQHHLTNTSTIPNSAIAEFSNNTGNLFGRISHIIRNEGFDYLPPFSMALASIGLNYSLYENIIKAAKATKNYDAIIVDTDSTFDKEKADLITFANKVFIVLEQSNHAVYATNTLLKNISCNDSEKYFFVCNNFSDSEPNALLTNNQQNFIINEYIRHLDNYESMDIVELSKQPDIQKVSYLVI